MLSGLRVTATQAPSLPNAPCLLPQYAFHFAAVESSLQHVFVGDNEGTLHMFNTEVAAQGQLSRLVWLAKVGAIQGDMAKHGVMQAGRCGGHGYVHLEEDW